MFNNNYNPYYIPPQRFQPNDMNTQPMNNNTYIPQINQPNNQYGLLGKSVESVDVVKAMDIPLDGSTSYFPLTDGSAIVTKKIQNDGTSKTVVYKPVDNTDNNKTTYATIDDIDNKLKEIDIDGSIKSFKDELKSIKKQIKEIKLELNDKED